jgi:hypothetical protein
MSEKNYVFISYIIKFHISPLVKKGGRFLALPFSVPSFWWGLTSFFQFSLFGGDSPAFFSSLFLVGTHQLLRINFFLYFIISNSRNFNNPFLQIFLFNYTVVFTPLIVACSSSPIGITRHFCPLITCDLICDAFSGFTRSTTSYVFVSAI